MIFILKILNFLRVDNQLIHEVMLDRRRFIRNSLLTAAGAGLAGRLSVSSEITPEPGNKLINRRLGKTGITLPVVSMGTGNAGNPALIRSALDKGVKLFATAAAYQEGNNERMLGEALKGIPRDSFMILTNSFDISWIDTPTGILRPDFSTDELLKRARASLTRLGVDHVDIFTQPFAARRESVFHGPAMQAMETIKKEGIARFIGIATHRYEPEAIRAAADSGIHDVIMTSYNFLKDNRDQLEDAIRYAADKGLGIIAMKTMAGAWYDRERTKPVNTRAALKWAIRNENIHTAVPDSSDFDQLTRNIDVMSDPELTGQELKDLFPLTGEKITDIYCQQCGECLPGCPYGVDIPTFMRSYMYAYGHHNMPLARNTLSEAGPAGNPCSECITCTAACRMGFDIRKKICEIARISDVPDALLPKDFIWR